MENTFTVTPMTQSFNLEPGKTYEGSITIANPAAATENFEYEVNLAPYGVSGTDYKADFMTDANRTQLAKWVTVENPKGSLAPNETVKIKFTIKVPENVPAGGQYAALMVGSANNNKGKGNVSVSNVYEMASLLYAEVAGETVRGGEILDNNVPDFVTQLPIRATASFKNEGNVHETAKISLIVKDNITGSQIYPSPEESGAVNETIMPETTRDFVREIDGISPLGVYSITQTIEYMGQTSSEHHIVIVCPIWFMALAAATIIAFIVVIVKMALKHRRKKVVL